MHVACATDQAYIPHCAAMMHSALVAHPGEAITFHLLAAPDIDVRTLDTLRDFVAKSGGELVAHRDLDARVNDLPVMDRIPAVMWYRVLLPELLPEVDRVLYLDADTLVVSELGPLWATPLDDVYLAAVSNVFEPGMAAHAVAIGIDDTTRYFNSGVLLLNLDLMRRDGCSSAILELARQRPLLWPDQDALNLVLGGRCALVHPRWNCMNTLFLGRDGAAVFGAERVEEAVRDPAVVHFEGPGMAKPWHYLNRHPRRADYSAHRRATPWPLLELEGRTLKNRVLRPLPTRTVDRVLRFEHRTRERVARR